jgi:flavoprotein hydroxylase
MTENGQPDADVMIVGYGPTGQTLAILLAQRGWNVTVIEKWSEPFPMPRAVSFDGESARILAAAGVGKEVTEFGEPSRDYVWRNGAGETLLHIDVAEHGYCGWPDSTSMYQPGLEAALISHGERFPALRVLRGHRAVELSDCGDRVEITAESDAGARVTLAAGWVVGCDGANSFVRERIGAELTDLGFASDWLTCDVVMHEPREFVPNNLQICDPGRPATAVSAGPGHRRWEFMRLPGETLEEFHRVDTVWRLLAPFDVNPRTATVVRHAVYRFEARYALEWRRGRLMIAGDAAHLMPPFAGQGMCSGFRDVANLAWKLDLVLRSGAGSPVLDTYTAERRGHVQHAIGMSVDLGKVICQPDRQAAADRDAVMLATRKRGASRPPTQSAVYQPLAGGLMHTEEGRPVSPAGNLVPQGRVARGRETGLFDDVVGRGFTLLARDDPRRRLDPEQLDFLDRLGTHLVHIRSADEPASESEYAVADIDGVYSSYMDKMKVTALLVRPDFYAFGGARDGDAIGGLVRSLRNELIGGSNQLPGD